MNQYAKVSSVTLQTSQGDIYFRSGFEGKIAIYLDMLLAGGNVGHWEYEPKRFKLVKYKDYLPDFCVFPVAGDGDHYWIEGKGILKPKDYNRIKEFTQLYPDELIEIYADGLPVGKTPKSRTALGRWQRLEKHVNRVVNANKLFKELGVRL